MLAVRSSTLALACEYISRQVLVPASEQQRLLYCITRLTWLALLVVLGDIVLVLKDEEELHIQNETPGINYISK